jgi:hypothetical protein
MRRRSPQSGRAAPLTVAAGSRRARATAAACQPLPLASPLQCAAYRWGLGRGCPLPCRLPCPCTPAGAALQGRPAPSRRMRRAPLPARRGGVHGAGHDRSRAVVVGCCRHWPTEGAIGRCERQGQPAALLPLPALVKLTVAVGGRSTCVRLPSTSWSRIPQASAPLFRRTYQVMRLSAPIRAYQRSLGKLADKRWGPVVAGWED